MSEWKEIQLRDISSDISYGYTASAASEEIGPKFLRITDITNGRVNWESVPYCKISDKDYKKYQLEVGDIVIARTGATTGFNSIIKSEVKAVYASYLIRFQIDKKVANPFFIGYILQSNNFQDYVDAIAGGSAQPGANAQQFADYEFLLPSIPEQTAIASILSSLDDKIDLLHRQNKTLEQLAETLFRQWFVKEADESWYVGKLGDVAVVQNGYAFSSRDYVPYQDGLLEVLKMGHIAVGGGLRTNPKKNFVPREEKFKKWTLNKNDIIMGMTDMKDNVVILGVPAMIDKSDKYVLNQRVARIYLKSNNKLVNSYLLYIQLNNKEFIATLQSKANSGVQVNLSTDAIKDCDILIPPLDLQMEKGTAITEFYLKKENNNNQIRTLTQLRDTLLPKLMSGEVRVSNSGEVRVKTEKE